MKFSYNWLKEYAAFDIPAVEFASRLTMAGIEVEEAHELGAGISAVVVAELLSVGTHPNADRLSLCEVGTSDDTFSIVCGAKNMKAGDKVALALHGARLPGIGTLKRSKIRGVVSEGMICSEVELGLAGTSDGVMILPPDLRPGEDLREALKLDDYVFEVGVTPNRPDCLSVRGLAREAAAVFGRSFKDIKPSLKETGPDVKGLVSIEIEAPELCRRYTARVIEGLKVSESPTWLKQRLELHGLRPINNVVDATNYVLLEYGQPLHAFDLDRVHGAKLTVRQARAGERVVTIDGTERRLAAGMLVISDEEGPEAIAGIMGGKGSEVTPDTTRILLESAWFDPVSVRRTSRKIGLSSDSSARFERGVDIEGVDLALARVTALICDLAGGKVRKGLVDLYPKPFKPTPVEIRLERAEQILGMGLKEGEVSRLLKSLGMSVKKGRKKNTLLAGPPSFRADDITEEVDLIEEIARLKGYDEVPTTMPVATLSTMQVATLSRGGVTEEAGRLLKLKDRTKEILVSSGFYEVINYSFVSEKAVLRSSPGHNGEPMRVLNPLSEEQSCMCLSLLPGLLENLRLNLSRSNDEVRIFEVRPVFPIKGKGGVQERWMASGLVCALKEGRGWNLSAERFGFFEIKGVVERLVAALGVPRGSVTFASLEKVPQSAYGSLLHPGKSAGVFVLGAEVGVIGEVHPDISDEFELKGAECVFELDMEHLAEVLASRGTLKPFTPLPRFPSSARDIAFVLDSGVDYGEIISLIRGIGEEIAGETDAKEIDTKLIENVELFDVYYGENIPPGKKSLALRILYRADDRTLKHSEVEEVHSKVSELLGARLGAEVRT